MTAHMRYENPSYIRFHPSRRVCQMPSASHSSNAHRFLEHLTAVIIFLVPLVDDSDIDDQSAVVNLQQTSKAQSPRLTLGT